MAHKKKDLEELRAVLLDKRKKILEHLAQLDGESKHNFDLGGDSADFASVEISQSALAKLGGREKRLLGKIDHALAKFEDGTYGICELTGEEIPVERLRARPEAQYTIEAKEQLERRERGYRHRSDQEDDDWDVGDSD